MISSAMFKLMKWSFLISIVAVVGFLIAGCSLGISVEVNPTLQPVEATIAPTLAPTDTRPPTDTATPLPPTVTLTPTATPLPTDTPTPSDTPTPTSPPPTPSGDQAIYIYLVQIGTGGPIACGDSLIKINTGLWRTGDNAADIATALRSLLVKSKYIAGLYNAVYLSNLSLVGVDFHAPSGDATIDMTGSYVRSGDRCDDARVHDQIWTTIRQFPGIKGNPLIRVNGNLLGDILSTAPGRESPKHKNP